MKTLGNYKKIAFDTLEELKSFIEDGYGDVMFYDDWLGEYHPVVINTYGEMVLGHDGFAEVEEQYLENIYAYERIM